MSEDKKNKPTSVLHLTDSNFDTELNSSNLPVLVDFWAPWCGPCRMLAPILDAIAEKFAGRIRVAKVNIDENPGVTGRFGILSIPTLIFFKDGKEVERLIGALPEAALTEKLNQLIS